MNPGDMMSVLLYGIEQDQGGGFPFPKAQGVPKSEPSGITIWKKGVFKLFPFSRFSYHEGVFIRIEGAKGFISCIFYQV